MILCVSGILLFNFFRNIYLSDEYSPVGLLCGQFIRINQYSRVLFIELGGGVVIGAFLDNNRWDNKMLLLWLIRIPWFVYNRDSLFGKILEDRCIPMWQMCQQIWLADKQLRATMSYKSHFLNDKCIEIQDLHM